MVVSSQFAELSPTLVYLLSRPTLQLCMLVQDMFDGCTRLLQSRLSSPGTSCKPAPAAECAEDTWPMLSAQCSGAESESASGGLQLADQAGAPAGS